MRTQARRDDIIAEDHQIIITSYASFRQDFDAYKAGKYDYLILDEAQVMKNTQTRLPNIYVIFLFHIA